MKNHQWFLMESGMLNLERKTKVVQVFFGLTNNRMTESDWLTFNHFNRGNPTKRMNDFVGQVASGEGVYHVKPVE